MLGILYTGMAFSQDISFKSLNLRNIIGSDVPGASGIDDFKLLSVENGEIISIGKAGNAYPLLFDWNRDGLKDLLVGDFGGGKLSNIRVYLNKGTANSPVWSSEWFYAEDTEGKRLFIMGS